MTPTDELRAAAAKIRALATAVSAPDPALQPFHAEGRDVTQGRTPGLYEVATTQTPALADYIAAMDPTVGLALANWLEWQARAFTEGHIAIPEAALAVARALNA